MRGERDRLNLVLENVADPILVTDERSNIILMNDQAEVLFQVSEAEPRTRRELADVRGNDTKFTSFISEFAMLDEDSRRERMTLIYPRSGTKLPVEVVSGKVKNERGEPIAVVSVLHDLTKQVENERLYDALKKLNSELERRIREATADLAEQNSRLQWQSQEVERANKLKSEFLASMSHELRTPINALIGYTALLLDGVLGEVNSRQRDALLRGRSAAEHLLALINDILDLAKIEAGKMPLHLEDVSLREVILEVTQQVEPMVRKKQLQFTIDIAPDCPPINIGPDEGKTDSAEPPVERGQVHQPRAASPSRRDATRRRRAHRRDRHGHRHPRRGPSGDLGGLPPGRPVAHPRIRRYGTRPQHHAEAPRAPRRLGGRPQHLWRRKHLLRLPAAANGAPPEYAIRVTRSARVRGAGATHRNGRELVQRRTFSAETLPAASVPAKTHRAALEVPAPARTPRPLHARRRTSYSIVSVTCRR